jgi:hypothetical protein
MNSVCITILVVSLSILSCSSRGLQAAATAASEASDKSAGFIATFPTSVLSGSKAHVCIRFVNIKQDVVLTIDDNNCGSFDKHTQTISTGQMD